MDTYLNEDDTAEIESLLLGRRVVSVNTQDESLVLDDGTYLKIIPNEGGCSCGAGDYTLEYLNGVDNVITKVECSMDENNYDLIYSVFVYADNERVNLFSVSGNDGSGYYGTGYKIKVIKP